MSSGFTLEVPVKPHVRKFIVSRFRQSDFISLTRTDFVGILIYNFLEKPDKQLRLKPILGSKITFRISEHILEHDGATISQEKVHYFNLFIDKLIKEQMYTYVDAYLHTHIEINHLIRDFMDQYSITEDDLKFETLKKAYYRYRKKRELY